MEVGGLNFQRLAQENPLAAQEINIIHEHKKASSMIMADFPPAIHIPLQKSTESPGILQLGRCAPFHGQDNTSKWPPDTPMIKPRETTLEMQ